MYAWCVDAARAWIWVWVMTTYTLNMRLELGEFWAAMLIVVAGVEFIVG